jgi:hypothetical protein
MKRGDTIKVIRSNPAAGQDPIMHLIGKVFKIISIDRDDNTVQVVCDEYEGPIVLQPSEYELVKEPFNEAHRDWQDIAQGYREGASQ